MKVKTFIYEKDNGDLSEREAIVIKEPRKNYLMIDVSNLDPQERIDVFDTLCEIEEYREERMNEIIGITHWRTFKPEGISWQNDN